MAAMRPFSPLYVLTYDAEAASLSETASDRFRPRMLLALSAAALQRALYCESVPVVACIVHTLADNEWTDSRGTQSASGARCVLTLGLQCR